MTFVHCCIFCKKICHIQKKKYTLSCKYSGLVGGTSEDCLQINLYVCEVVLIEVGHLIQ